MFVKRVVYIGGLLREDQEKADAGENFSGFSCSEKYSGFEKVTGGETAPFENTCNGPLYPSGVNGSSYRIRLLPAAGFSGK